MGHNRNVRKGHNYSIFQADELGGNTGDDYSGQIKQRDCRVVAGT